MTIIKTNNKRKNVEYFVTAFVFLFLAMGIICILEYGSFVRIKYDVRTTEVEINNLEKANAELKNKLYGKLDPRSLEAIAVESGFSLEGAPNYIKNGD